MSHRTGRRVREEELEAPTTFKAQMALCIPNLILLPSSLGLKSSCTCSTDQETKGGSHPLRLTTPLSNHTHIRAPARVTGLMASQPGQSRCPLFLASPRENSLPAGACPILSPSPHFLLLPTSFLPALGYSLCRKGPRFRGKASRSSCPGQDTCFLHHVALSALARAGNLIQA